MLLCHPDPLYKGFAHVIASWHMGLPPARHESFDRFWRDDVAMAPFDRNSFAMNEGALDQKFGSIHHVELWVPDLGRAVDSFGWLFETLGYRPYQNWPRGRSWILGQTYIVVEESPAAKGDNHNRLLPGLNHLAFHAGRPDDVEMILGLAPQHGWDLLFPERHPYAGGPDHYAVYLANVDGFEVELVAATVGS